MKDVKQAMRNIEKHGYSVKFEADQFSFEGSRVVITENNYYNVALPVEVALNEPLDYIIGLVKSSIEKLKEDEKDNKLNYACNVCSNIEHPKNSKYCKICGTKI